jgi:hypothetical protein
MTRVGSSCSRRLRWSSAGTVVKPKPGVVLPGTRASGNGAAAANPASLTGDVNAWDSVNNDSMPQDDNGHGTHVAGIPRGEGGLS